jgi:CheY-like chemotaxis protein
VLCADNSINQRIISKMLTRLGFTAQQFRLTGDGQSAAEEIQRENAFGNEAESDALPHGSFDGATPGVALPSLQLPASQALATPLPLSSPSSALGGSCGVASEVSLSPRRDSPSSRAATRRLVRPAAPYHMVLMDLQMRTYAIGRTNGIRPAGRKGG